jgi:hypothetical protein
VPLNEGPESADNITAFTVKTGAASKFNYTVPIPGSHRGRVTDVSAAGQPRASPRCGSRVRRHRDLKKRPKTRQ